MRLKYGIAWIIVTLTVATLLLILLSAATVDASAAGARVNIAGQLLAVGHEETQTATASGASFKRATYLDVQIGPDQVARVYCGREDAELCESLAPGSDIHLLARFLGARPGSGEGVTMIGLIRFVE